MAIVVNDVACLVEFKRVRPNAVSNSDNRQSLGTPRPQMGWTSSELEEFETKISEMERGDVGELIVHFDDDKHNWRLPRKGWWRRESGEKLRVRNYLEFADEQLDRYEASFVDDLEARGLAKTVYFFSAVQVGRRWFVRLLTEKTLD